MALAEISSSSMGPVALKRRDGESLTSVIELIGGAIGVALTAGFLLVIGNITRSGQGIIQIFLEPLLLLGP